MGHVGGSIVDIAATFRENVRLTVQQKCPSAIRGSYCGTARTVSLWRPNSLAILRMDMPSSGLLHRSHLAFCRNVGLLGEVVTVMEQVRFMSTEP